MKEYLQETTQPFSQNKKPENDDDNQRAIEKINASIVEHLLNEASLSKKIDHLLETANKLGISQATIDKFEAEYDDDPDEEILEHCLC